MSGYVDKVLTIFICCYNSRQTLAACLDSLVRQSTPGTHYQVIFVNDGSFDGSLEIAKSYSTCLNNLMILNNQETMGLARCCNKAIDIIDTPYLMRLDSDDYLSPDAVEIILKEVHSSRKADFIVFGRWDMWDSHMKRVDVSDDIYTWTAAGTVFSTEAIKKIEGYSEEYWEEYDLYIKLLEAGYKYKISHHHIYYYRRGQGGMTRMQEENKRGFESLLSKWGQDTLKKYGQFKRILEYYSQENGKRCQK